MTITNRQKGFTLVEFMVAMTISVIVLASLTALLVTSMRSHSELQRANEQIENGRYAMQVLAEDLRLSGYYANFDITNIDGGVALPPDTADPCTTTLANLDANFPVFLQGSDNSESLSCVSDHRANTDVVVIRRVSTCAAGVGGCASVTGAPYFQASRCSNANELQSVNYRNRYRLDTNIANLDRTLRDCATNAQRRRLLTHIYFIANNNNPSDGIPTLKRAELVTDASNNMTFQTVPLAEGIESLQFEYGIDTDNDSQINAYTANPNNWANPGTGTNCSTTAPTTCIRDNWQNVKAVKVFVLARSLEGSRGHSDDKTYSLGLNANGSANDVGPFNDDFKRHVFKTVVRLNNPAGR